MVDYITKAANRSAPTQSIDIIMEQFDPSSLSDYWDTIMFSISNSLATSQSVVYSQAIGRGVHSWGAYLGNLE
jgi:hypothetical protein